MNTNPLRALCLAVTLACIVPLAASAQSASQFYSEGVQSYEAGNVDAAKQKLRLALEADKNFRPAAALLVKIAADERQATGQPLGVSVKTLEKVIVPVDFKDTSLQTAVEILRQRISEKTGGKVEVNFIFKLQPELANKRISLRLDRVPATEVMRYLGELAGVNFRIEQYAVMIVPAAAPTKTASSSPAGAASTP